MNRAFLAFGSIFAACVLAGFGSCDKTPAWKHHSFSRRDIKPSGAAVPIPEGLWDKVRGMLEDQDANKPEKSEKSGKAAEESGGEEKLHGNSMSLPTEFAPLKVYLIQKNEGVLKTDNLELGFAPGGGEIDLEDFIGTRRGSFYFLAEFMPDLEGATRKIFYLSNSIARERKVDGETERIGGGCHNYYDVTSAFAKAALGEGFLLNTTDERHVSALAGTYIFAALTGQSKTDKKLYLATLTIRDSSHRNLMCRH